MNVTGVLVLEITKISNLHAHHRTLETLYDAY